MLRLQSKPSKSTQQQLKDCSPNNNNKMVFDVFNRNLYNATASLSKSKRKCAVTKSKSKSKKTVTKNELIDNNIAYFLKHKRWPPQRYTDPATGTRPGQFLNNVKRDNTSLTEDQRGRLLELDAGVFDIRHRIGPS